MKRYLHEKIAFLQEHRPQDEHVLIVPGAKNEVTASGRSRIYSVASPLVSRTSLYRAFLRLGAIDEILDRERPDIIESADPYQLGWKALRAGAAYRIPVVAYYHSHFADAYLRAPARQFGERVCEFVMSAARNYTRDFYNRFAATFVAAGGMGELLRTWGVRNTELVGLGVEVGLFHPGDDRGATRRALGVESHERLLLYVGRLAGEKNSRTLFDAVRLFAQRRTGLRLLVIGDGPERVHLQKLERDFAGLRWLPSCNDRAELAAYYRAADLFVHPGVEETFGLAALESQACGTAVVGIRGSFMDEAILHDQSTWAEENSAHALASAIERTLVRPDLADLGRAAAIKVLQRYAWPEVFARLFSIYGTVVASYRGAP